MPIPSEAFTITGGCHCGALRYRIAVPPFEERPHVFTLGPDADLSDPTTPRLPVVMACHCDSCRATSGNMTTQFIMQPGYMMTVSAIPRCEDEANTRAVTGRIMELPTSMQEVAEADQGRPPYIPAVDVLRPGVPGSANTWLHFFHSFSCSEDLSRSFCGRCGSPVAVHYRPDAEYMGPLFVKPTGWLDVVDVFLGSVDKHILGKEDLLQVEHEVNLDDAVSWAKRTMLTGSAEGCKFHGGSEIGLQLRREDI